jgi:hypothetical protein
MHLMDLDSSNGLFNEGSHTLKHQERLKLHTFILCATEMITLKEIQELTCGRKILVTLYTLSLSFSTNL